MKRDDGLFYRGKILLDNDDAVYTVFFIDYGYTELMHYTDIYQWNRHWDLVPGIEMVEVFFFGTQRIFINFALIFSSSASMHLGKCPAKQV